MLHVVVGFQAANQAWILLVGPHDDRDPGIDVYTALYELAGAETAPALGNLVEEIVARARRLRRTRT